MDAPTETCRACLLEDASFETGSLFPGLDCESDPACGGGRLCDLGLTGCTYCEDDPADFDRCWQSEVEPWECEPVFVPLRDCSEFCG